MGDGDAKLTKNALALAQRITKDKKPNLLVRDEINLAVQYQLVEPREAP
jgi:ATP:corrinoid adenosyltransferase